MKKILQILSVFLLSCLAVVLLGIVNQQKAKASDCNWVNSGHIQCAKTDYYFSPPATLQYGVDKYAIFVGGSSTADQQVWVNLGGDGSNAFRWHIPLQDGEDPSAAQNSRVQTQSDIGDQDKRTADAPNDDCSVNKPYDCNQIHGDKDDSLFTTGVYSGKFVATDAQKTALDALKGGVKQQTNTGNDCVKSALSFFLCPINEAIKSALDSTINLVAGVLQTDAPGINSNTAVRNAEQAFVNIANSIYVVVFLLIILANFIALPGQFFENYTIKKTLPKLIAAIILTQFMFFICIAIMDLSNIAGATIPVAIVSAYKGSPQTLGSAISQAFNPLTQDGLAQAGITAALDVGYFIFAQIILIVALVVALIGMFYIIFRQFALYVLIILSPLAMAAWVLPGTSKYTKQWFELYIKLCLMYLIVMLIIAFTAIGVDIFKSIATQAYISSLKSVSGAALGPGPSLFFALLTALIIPVIGLILITRAFKWSSKAVTEGGRLLSESRAGKAATGTAKGAVKNSAKEGKIADLGGKKIQSFGEKSGIQSLTRKGALMQSAASKNKREKYESLPVGTLQGMVTGGDPNSEQYKLAQGALRKKYREKVVEAKQAFDAGLTLNDTEQASFNELATAAGVTGGSYDESVATWQSEKITRSDADTIQQSLQSSEQTVNDSNTVLADPNATPDQQSSAQSKKNAAQKVTATAQQEASKRYRERSADYRKAYDSGAYSKDPATGKVNIPVADRLEFNKTAHAAAGNTDAFNPAAGHPDYFDQVTSTWP